MTKALTNHYLTFALACLLVIATFITATSFIQLALAALLYPVLMFFAYKMYTSKPGSRKVVVDEVSAETTDKKPLEKIVISDIDKRVFLKLIGSAGIFIFLFSLFNKKAENMFYKSLPEKGKSFFNDGKEAPASATPTIVQPTEEYGISEIDSSSETSYYGYTKLGGAWYIMKVDTATNSFRYIKGDKNFPNSWKSRQKLKYDYFGNVF